MSTKINKFKVGVTTEMESPSPGKNHKEKLGDRWDQIRKYGVTRNTPVQRMEMVFQL